MQLTENQSLVRDVAHAHCREDLAGRVPSLNEWLDGIDLHGQTDARERPRFEPPELDAFMWKPYLRTGLDASLEITFSDFGVHLVENVLSPESALAVTERLGPLPSIGRLLDAFRFQDRWQHSPRRRELEWLRTTEQP